MAWCGLASMSPCDGSAGSRKVPASNAGFHGAAGMDGRRRSGVRPEGAERPTIGLFRAEESNVRGVSRCRVAGIRDPSVVEIRKKEITVLSGAESTYGDWRGTACAENSLMVGASDLYELAGLAGERDRWSILGIQMDASSHGADPRWTIRVYAADRLELGVSSFDDWARVAAEHGGIPVVDILLHEATPEAVIKCMKLVGIQLRRGSLDQPLLHAAYADHPNQD
jgi:hypothetical protein